MSLYGHKKIKLVFFKKKTSSDPDSTSFDPALKNNVTGFTLKMHQIKLKLVSKLG